jgi:glycerol-1-phosphate dehydrogenase [NAD(P)+]
MKKCWPIPTIEYLPFGEVTESRRVALVTHPKAWEAVGDSLHLKVASRIDILEADEAIWKEQAKSLEGEVVYSVGGGLTVDAAKYFSCEANLPLLCLPTALSVDAFLTWASGVRVKGCVKYLETRCPDVLILDLEVLGRAPENIRAAGICDVLSIATGNWDWGYAEEIGKNSPETPYIRYIADCALALLAGAMDCAEAAGRGDPGGLRQLLECLAMEVQMCNLIGHPRPEEGSEHYFAYSVENTMGKGLPHGDLVGPGILLMAHLQGQNTEMLRKALLECRIPLDSIPRDVALSTLRGLPRYCVEHGLAHGLAHDLTEEHFQLAERFLASPHFCRG